MMHAIYLASVGVHVLAALTWTGGIAFLVLVVVPLLRKGDRAQAAEFLRVSGTRFRAVGWTCFALLAGTGVVNLWFRGVHARDLVDPAWLRSPAGSAIAVKLALFVAILAVSGVHDFFVGPHATALVARDPDSPAAERVRRTASLLGRVVGVLALAIVAAAVILVRGWP